MCGIVGFCKNDAVLPDLLRGLEALEYRGYDSAGIAVFEGEKIRIVREKGRLSSLKEKIASQEAITGSCGIGHTRWATHGAANEKNAHPHFSEDGKVAAVHNGILENYAEIKADLIKRGYTFYSETDTEVAVKYIRFCYSEKKDPVRALCEFIRIAHGSYALAVLFSDFPGEIYATRKDSPLVIGKGKGESFLASDPSAIKKKASFFLPEDGEIVRLFCGGAEFFDKNGARIEKKSTPLVMRSVSEGKGCYPHYMQKEICEQPAAVEKTLRYALKNGKIRLGRGITDAFLRKLDQICIVGCGSAYHVAVITQYAVEKLAGTSVRVDIASEFRYRDPPFFKSTLFVVISQSGETADALAALRMAKGRKGVKTLAVVNAPCSSMAREADAVFYTQAGAEIAVATTKAYSAQLIFGYLLSIRIAKCKGKLRQNRYERLLSALNELPKKMEKVIEKRAVYERIANRIKEADSVFFIGRGTDYGTAMEGSLKLKEISYIPSEAYAAGELKHGPISLVQKGSLVIGILTEKTLFQKTVSNLSETVSRGATVLTVGRRNAFPAEKCTLPVTDELFYASLAVIPLQFFAYFTGVLRGLDVDKPRNLAKSVTVE